MKRIHGAVSGLMAGLWIGLSGVSQAGGAILVGVGETIEPGATFEVRFEDPMVSSDEVGLPGLASPVEFAPPLDGDFVWLSRSSGIFSPGAVPSPGAGYVLSTRAGLESEEGKKIPVRVLGEWEVPAFGVSAWQGPPAERLPPLPEVLVAFTEDVRDESLETSRVEFVSGDGSRIAGVVEAAVRRDTERLGPAGRAWSARWENRGDGGPGGLPWDAPEWMELAGNAFKITPEVPLATGVTWALDIPGGIQSVDGQYRTAGPISLPLGEVAPFKVQSVVGENLIFSGPSVRMRFSDAVAPDVDGETGLQFFRVEPPVEGLALEASWLDVIIRGDFEPGKSYRLVVGDDVVSAAGLPLSGSREHEFRVPPVSPRVYLPAITAEQLASGRREFELLNVNIDRLEIIARAVRGADAARAVAAFEKYPRQVWKPESPDELFEKLPADAIGGEVIGTEQFDLGAAETDEPVKTVLNWNKVVGEAGVGVVFLTAEGTPDPKIGGLPPGAQALVQITDLGVAWKKSGAGLSGRVFSLTGGTPVADSEILLLDEKFESIGTAVSGAGGEFVLFAGKDPAWMVVSHGNDVLAMRAGPTAAELPMAAFGLPLAYAPWSPGPDQLGVLRGMLFSDRPLYRPGEVVRLKGLVRRMESGSLESAPDLEGRLLLRDPRGRENDAGSIKTAGDGSFDAEIPAGMATGAYAVRVDFPGWDAQPWWDGGMIADFQVGEYQPDPFEVVVNAPAEIAPGGGSLLAEVSGRYFFGAPLGQADIKWTLQTGRSPFEPEGFEQFVFLNPFESGDSQLALRGEAKIEGGESATIAAELPTPGLAPLRGTLTVEVTDLNQQTVSSLRTFVANASDFYLGIESGGYRVLRAGDPIEVRVVAVSADGSPWPEPVSVDVDLIRLRDEVVRVRGAGNMITFQRNSVEEPVAGHAGKTLDLRENLGEWTAADGNTATLSAAEPGRYFIRVTGRDPGGNPAVTQSMIHVVGSEEVVWDFRSPYQIDLVPDKPTYRAGDTARVLVKSPIEGKAWVTLERGNRVMRSMEVELAGDSPVVEVPILEGDGPNIFLSLMMVRGADASPRKFPIPEFRYGVCMLPVENPEAELIVRIAPADNEVQPGDEVVAGIAVFSADGEPVRDAEVTFFAVDDGVLSLVGYERPDPEGVFDGPIPLRIRTGISLVSLLPEDPADLQFGNKGYLIGGGGEGSPEKAFRDDFPGTAAWMPSLRTGEDGTVVARFDAPDALTRYRLVAVASMGSDAFGSAESAIAIRKPLMLMPGLGQFANVGDRLIARATLRNDTGTGGTASVSLDVGASATLEGDASREIDVGADESVAVDFAVRIDRQGDADWHWKANLVDPAAGFSDAVVSPLRIGTPMVVLREILFRDARGGADDLLKGINPQIAEGSGALVITLSNSRLTSIRESIDYLRDYPFGCAEQTASRLVPWVVLPQVRNVLGSTAPSKAEAAKAVQSGVATLLSMQTADGGLAFWPGSNESSLYASAFATLILARLESLGEPMPAEFGELTNYLAGQLRGVGDRSSQLRPAELADRVLALYALEVSGNSEASFVDVLYAQKESLPQWARDLLASAIRLSGEASDPRIAALMDSARGAPEDFSVFGGMDRNLAIRLLALLSVSPDSDEIAPLTQELLALRSNGRWLNTQGNAWALLALGEYCAKIEVGGGGAVSGELHTSRGTVPFAIDSGAPVFTTALDWDPRVAEEGIGLTTDGDGPVFAELRFVVSPVVGGQPPQNRGYAIRRNYARIAEDGTLEEARDLQVGDRIVVTLEVENSQPGVFVAIEDPVPAILEPVNPEFTSRSVGAADGFASQDARVSFREMRADRVRFFCDNFRAGVHRFQYLARVRMAGEASAGATRVEEMYRPQRFGLGEIATLRSSP